MEKKKIYIGDIHIGDDEKALVNQVLESGRFSEGEKIRAFEELWKRYIGTQHCVAFNSGTSAIMASLFALLIDERFEKVKKGSKVITSPVTYVATSNAIMLAGMEPVYVDIDPHTFTLDVNAIEDLLQKGNPDDYSMILPIHLMGYPNDMDAINLLAEKYNLVVFEDAAQAHGSLYKGKKVGTYSLLADFSFYIAHNIQVGEMGAIVTNDAIIRRRIKQLKANGRLCACPVCVRMEGKCPYKNEIDELFDPRFNHEYIGFNFKSTEFQAAIAIPQIEKADEIKSQRLRNVHYLNEKMSKYSDAFQLPVYSEDISYLAYPIIIKDHKISRKKLINVLEEKGVETRILFGCIPLQQKSFEFLKEKYRSLLPMADKVGSRGFYIGCHQYLSKDELDYIVEVFDQIMSD